MENKTVVMTDSGDVSLDEIKFLADPDNAKNYLDSLTKRKELLNNSIDSYTGIKNYDSSTIRGHKSRINAEMQRLQKEELKYYAIMSVLDLISPDIKVLFIKRVCDVVRENAGIEDDEQKMGQKLYRLKKNNLTQVKEAAEKKLKEMLVECN